MLKKLLSHGYFPLEIPEPFNTRSYSELMIQEEQQAIVPFSYGRDGPNFTSRCAKYNLGRRGKLRRPLSIPNPINYYHTAKIVADNWDAFNAIYDISSQSISKPVIDDGSRALAWEKGFSYLPESKLKTRTASKYILKADIANFYSSIYTHSISWAIHGKAEAKSKRYFKNNLGNKVDTLLRNGQDQQTKGIPIGSDVSFAVAELIMTAIDKILVEKIGNNYHRYIDDFEFGCQSYQEAEHILAVLQETLAFYELELNASKTEIVELPEEIEPYWLHQLQQFNIGMSSASLQRRDLLSFFDLTMEFLKKEPCEPILKYAVVRTASHIVRHENYNLYQRILLQWAVAEPSTLPIVIDFVKFYKESGIEVDLDEIKKTLQYIIVEHSRAGHTSEVSWAIFGMLLFNLGIDDDVSNVLSTSENPFIALLTLDAKRRGLITEEHTFELWANLMTVGELNSDNWPLAYEAYQKGWLPSLTGENYILEHEGFKLLADNGVEFYSSELIDTYNPKLKYHNFNNLSAEQLRYFIYRDVPLVRPEL